MEFKNKDFLGKNSIQMNQLTGIIQLI